MSEKESATVTVRILEKEYFVSCPQDERADLLDSAEYLNKKMREIRDTGKVVGADRIAVMAALNMANELLRTAQARHGTAGRGEWPREATCASASRLLFSARASSILKALNDVAASAAFSDVASPEM